MRGAGIRTSKKNTQYFQTCFEKSSNQGKKESKFVSYRREVRIFKLMAEEIGTRDGIQCRSHHMKQLRTYSKIRNIINHFKKGHQFSREGKKFQIVLREKALAFDLRPEENQERKASSPQKLAQNSLYERIDNGNMEREEVPAENGIKSSPYFFSQEMLFPVPQQLIWMNNLLWVVWISPGTQSPFI